MKNLITGGAGFIGSHLAVALIERGEEVYVIDDLSTGSIENIDHLREDDRFHLDGGSWTNNLNWVRGYESVLTPMLRLSARFNEVIAVQTPDTASPAYRNALLHLLCSQTSCFRYWGRGTWTDYAVEICRRGMAVLDSDF